MLYRAKNKLWRYVYNRYTEIIDGIRSAYERGGIPGVKQYVDTNKADAKVVFVYAKSVEVAGNIEKAESLYRLIIEMFNKNTHARFALGKICAAQGRYEEAEELFLECIRINYKNLYARFELGRLCAAQGRDEEAEELFRSCEQSPYTKLELGRLYAKKWRYEEAESLFRGCLEINPRDVIARFELGKICGAQGRDEEAERLFRECMELEPENQYVPFELGRLYAKQGKNEKAEELFNKCIEYDPKNIYAFLELEQLRDSKGDFNAQGKLIKYLNERIHYGMNEGWKQHIQNHYKDNIRQPIHVIFKKTKGEIESAVLQQLKEAKIGQGNAKIRRGEVIDIYVLYLPECGVEGGYKGDRHQLDYLTIIANKRDHKIITMFPSDDIRGLIRGLISPQPPHPGSDGSR